MSAARTFTSWGWRLLERFGMRGNIIHVATWIAIFSWVPPLILLLVLLLTESQGLFTGDYDATLNYGAFALSALGVLVAFIGVLRLIREANTLAPLFLVVAGIANVLIAFRIGFITDTG